MQISQYKLTVCMSIELGNYVNIKYRIILKLIYIIIIIIIIFICVFQLPYICVKNGVYQLKKEHQYYFQIQGQMHITGRHQCYFLIYTPEWTHLEIIQYDDVFWSTTMEKKLKLYVFLNWFYYFRLTTKMFVIQILRRMFTSGNYRPSIL